MRDTVHDIVRRQATPLLSTTLRLLLAALLVCCVTPLASAEEAQWIWSDDHNPQQVPHVACHFRKSISVLAPEQGQISIVADDKYELFVNGRRAGHGVASEHLQDHDVSRFLSNGRNVIAIKVTNTDGPTAGVAARVMIREHVAGWRTFPTDQTWKTSLRPLPFWNTTIYNDNRWPTATTLGQLGRGTPETSNGSDAADVADGPGQRFKVANDFAVEQLIDNEKSGSLIAIAFNEFGHLIAAREGGPLLLIYDNKNDGQLDTVREYCSQVKNCQGILALNGDVYVTADGPNGAALYHLRDEDQDGQLESVRSLIRFGDEMREHGAHGLALGPDGLIYVVAGNQATSELEFDPVSPHRDFYEGDLLRPRFEDPSGHAAGVKAPGGIVLRTDLDGLTVEAFAGGFRNPYDLTFDRHGELFVHDSDMESDRGTTWYRPTRLYHVTAGAEFGWRSGWAKWPDYFIDSLPAVLDTGRGSPTGAVCYDHFAFPTKYHGSLFMGDWSEGRILAIRPQKKGGSYTATQEVFLEGQPLNVTDLAVGPDGELYFSTGGRGTDGGLYRVKWQGEIPENVSDLGKGMSRAIRFPQLASAASRQHVARIQSSLGDDWGPQLVGVVRSTENPWYYRTRALELMQLFGPSPSADLLARLSNDKSEMVRAKAAELMGLDLSSRSIEELNKMLKDPNLTVRRRACESLLAASGTTSLKKLAPLLVSGDRAVAWAARRRLERLPPEEWRDTVLSTDQHRLFIQGSLALVIAHPEKDNGLAILDRFRSLLDEFITDKDFIDMLRLTQVTLDRCRIGSAESPELRMALGEEFPSSNPIMNRELVRALMYLQAAEPMDRYLAYLKSDAKIEEKLHLAMNLRFLNDGWNLERRIQLISFYELLKQREESASFERYVGNAETSFGKSLPLEEGLAILERGREWPDAAIGVLYQMPPELDGTIVEKLKVVDRQLREGGNNQNERLRLGILAVMARSGDPESLKYLRYVWDTEPERREVAVLGLAHEAEDNWDYLVRSLPILDGESAKEVISKLQTVDAAPDEPQPYRQLILSGLRLADQGAEQVLALLAHWTGNEVESGIPWDEQIKIWQDWFASEYPEEPSAILPVASKLSKWDFDELYAHLTSEDGAAGSPKEGAVVFEKALCSKCHRYGNRGEPLGPDLTSIGKRFMKKEVLQAILYPSHTISDQYRSKSVITTQGRTYSGIVASGVAGGVIILQSSGEKQAVRESEIDEIIANRQSAMPDRLLDSLSLVEISDLFAYLGLLPTDSVARRPTDRIPR